MTMTTTTMNKRQAFFAAMFKGLDPYSQLEFRLIQAGEFAKTAFYFVDTDWDQKDAFIEQWNGKRNIFFGIYPRQGSDGSDAGVKQLTCCYADIDVVKDHAGDWQGCCQRIKSFQHKPSIMVKSGNGLHCYWLFDKPVDVTETTTLMIKEIIRGIAVVLGGDANVIRLSHPFRVPETWNTKKPDDLKLCELIEINESRYSIDDFERYRVKDIRDNKHKHQIIDVDEKAIDDVVDLLDVVHFDGLQVQAYCPFHEPRNSPSFFMKVTTGQWYCHSTSCSTPQGGGIRTFKRKWAAKQQQELSRLFITDKGNWRI